MTNPDGRRFGPYPHGSTGIPTAAASYADGHATGLTWRHVYTPGGPLVFRATVYEDADWRALCDATAENNREWLRGWTDGRTAALTAPHLTPTE
jgi:hypothetical protein